jgi:8-oxo-dGTP pyrophosphatase MutT (NUDIX family)
LTGTDAVIDADLPDMGWGIRLSDWFGRGLFRSPAESELDSGSVTMQFGAIPYRHVDGEIVFLMITTKRTGKWIFPKGGKIAGLSPPENAAQEAYEEAGVRGKMGSAPLGHYASMKPRPGGAIPVSIEMYPLEVSEQLDDWPEKGERKRHWVTLADARRLLSEPALVTMAEKIAG